MENIKSPTELKMNGINKTLKKAEKTKYKVTGYKKVVYDLVEIIFEDDEKFDIKQQAVDQIEAHNDNEMVDEIDVEYEIESLEVIK